MQSNNGYYGEFGGSYIPEILYSSQQQILHAFEEAKNDPAFIAELKDTCRTILAALRR